jgi:hypothetical protein
VEGLFDLATLWQAHFDTFRHIPTDFNGFIHLSISTSDTKWRSAAIVACHKKSRDLRAGSAYDVRLLLSG